MPEFETTTTDAVQDHARHTVRRVLDADKLVADDVRDEILALNAAAVPPLLELLEDEELALSGSQGDGWAPVHAACLLGELQAAEAIEPMLRVLATTDTLDTLHDQVIQCLPLIGAPVIEPALRAWAANEDRGFRYSIAAVLAEVGVRDERIYCLLIAQLQEDPYRAGNLAVYGDERAIPHLSQALDNCQIVESASPFANQTLVELRAAIEDLGGTLTAEQLDKCRRGDEPAGAFRRKMAALVEARKRATSEPVRRRDRPGRNDPCWCGSSRKYKKCHLAADENATFVARART